MPVRIYFRGLILFRFQPAKNGVELVAELINNNSPFGNDPKDDHQPEIQVATGEDYRSRLADFQKLGVVPSGLVPPPNIPGSVSAPNAALQTASAFARDIYSVSVPRDVAGIQPPRHLLLPRSLDPGMDVRISVRDCKCGVRAARSFYDYVPNVDYLARMAQLPRARGGTKRSGKKASGKRTKQNRTSYSPVDDLKLRQQFVRNSVTVDCGTIRVKDVVSWDTGHPIDEALQDRPSSPAEIKFMGVGFSGYAANECVVDVPERSDVTVTVSDNGNVVHQTDYPSAGGRNQLAAEDNTEIMIRNYEYQRTQPVPWGMDFQWLFARLGYGEANLGNELNTFRGLPRAPKLDALLQEDIGSLLPNWPNGRPFPYIASNTCLTRLAVLSPLTDIQSRPVCVPGRGG